LQDPFLQRATCQILSRTATSLLAPVALREFAASAPPGSLEAAADDGGEAARAAFLRRTYESLTRLLLCGGGNSAAAAAGGGNWPAVAEAAVGALYALHPRPAAAAGAVVERLALASGLIDGEGRGAA
jgi:hypothetical protein